MVRPPTLRWSCSADGASAGQGARWSACRALRTLAASRAWPWTRTRRRSALRSTALHTCLGCTRYPASPSSASAECLAVCRRIKSDMLMRWELCITMPSGRMARGIRPSAPVVGLRCMWMRWNISSWPMALHMPLSISFPLYVKEQAHDCSHLYWQRRTDPL